MKELRDDKKMENISLNHSLFPTSLKFSRVHSHFPTFCRYRPKYFNRTAREPFSLYLFNELVIQICFSLATLFFFYMLSLIDDILVLFSFVNAVCDPKSLLFVFGMELDYSDALIGGGFSFRNPNATQTCGCGKSFAAEM